MTRVDYFTKQTIEDYQLEGKRVLLRSDLNVPINDLGQVADDYRISASAETILALLEKGCSLVVMSHLGRPEGKVDPHLSLAPVSKKLQQLLHGYQVEFIDECVGPKVEAAVKRLRPGQVLLLENTRFHKEDEDNDQEFAKVLASYGQVFVMDAFGSAHRSHASTTGVCRYLPSIAGLLLQKEVNTIRHAIEGGKRPSVLLFGGAKFDKLHIIKSLLTKFDAVLVGGALANAFIAAKGHKIGQSLCDEDAIYAAQSLVKQANASGTDIVLPFDVVVASKVDSKCQPRLIQLEGEGTVDLLSYPSKVTSQDLEVMPDEKILDIGPQTANYYAGLLASAKTVVWSGTMGVTEIKGLHGLTGPFRHGSNIVAAALSSGIFGHKPFTVVGGGDTIGYVESVSGLKESLAHVSTGGGASLQLIAGQPLPGVDALLDKERV